MFIENGFYETKGARKQGGYGKERVSKQCPQAPSFGKEGFGKSSDGHGGRKYNDCNGYHDGSRHTSIDAVMTALQENHALLPGLSSAIQQRHIEQCGVEILLIQSAIGCQMWGSEMNL